MHGHNVRNVKLDLTSKYYKCDKNIKRCIQSNLIIKLNIMVDQVLIVLHGSHTAKTFNGEYLLDTQKFTPPNAETEESPRRLPVAICGIHPHLFHLEGPRIYPNNELGLTRRF